MKTKTINIDEAIFKRLKITCAEKGQNIGETASKIIDSYLKRIKK